MLNNDFLVQLFGDDQTAKTVALVLLCAASVLVPAAARQVGRGAKWAAVRAARGVRRVLARGPRPDPAERLHPRTRALLALLVPDPAAWSTADLPRRATRKTADERSALAVSAEVAGASRAQVDGRDAFFGLPRGDVKVLTRAIDALLHELTMIHTSAKLGAPVAPPVAPPPAPGADRGPVVNVAALARLVEGYVVVVDPALGLNLRDLVAAPYVAPGAADVRNPTHVVAHVTAPDGTAVRVRVAAFAATPRLPTVTLVNPRGAGFICNRPGDGVVNLIWVSDDRAS